ncbi:MAG: WecB/TagA/CpsF family glycosyltransferase [Oscillospiraceae bacterium]|nr:WecB/TagA/CpsF family glycosyltransferase [Oscillospiraceae bacterium]
MRIDVIGVGFDDVTAMEAISFACNAIGYVKEDHIKEEKEHSFDTKSMDSLPHFEQCYVVTPNPEIVWLARQNEELMSAISNAGLVLADGVGITIAARILGTPIHGGRVPGIDFAQSLLYEMSQYGGSVYLLGAKPGVAIKAGKQLEEKFPGLVIAGTADGYFTDDLPIIENINEANPDVLFVCLGSPKQELWMANNLSLINAKLCAGLGGSLDVFAGNVKRAPAIFRKTGFEWFYRLLQDPKRIKRMAKLPLFLLRVIWKRITGK